MPRSFLCAVSFDGYFYVAFFFDYSGVMFA